MTVKEILKKYLKDNGYDGLFTDSCGCRVGDLMPCLGLGILNEPTDCQPGYVTSCPDKDLACRCEKVWDCIKCPGAFIGRKPEVKP